jgi:hypothetical protein
VSGKGKGVHRTGARSKLWCSILHKVSAKRTNFGIQFFAERIVSFTFVLPRFPGNLARANRLLFCLSF